MPQPPFALAVLAEVLLAHSWLGCRIFPPQFTAAAMTAICAHFCGDHVLPHFGSQFVVTMLVAAWLCTACPSLLLLSHHLLTSDLLGVFPFFLPFLQCILMLTAEFFLPKQR